MNWNIESMIVIQTVCVADVTLSTSLFVFHLISFSPHFIVHVPSYFLQSKLHWSCFIFISFSPQAISFIHLTQSISFIFILFGCIHITWLFNHIVSFTFQPIPSLEINDLRVSLDKVLILDRYSLLEAELRWLHHSFPLYIKQEIQHGVRRNILVRSVADVYLIIHSTQTYLGKW